MLKQVKQKVIPVEKNTYDDSYKYLFLIGSCYFNCDITRCWHARAVSKLSQGQDSDTENVLILGSPKKA